MMLRLRLLWCDVWIAVHERVVRDISLSRGVEARSLTLLERNILDAKYVEADMRLDAWKKRRALVVGGMHVNRVSRRVRREFAESSRRTA